MNSKRRKSLSNVEESESKKTKLVSTPAESSQALNPVTPLTRQSLRALKRKTGKEPGMKPTSTGSIGCEAVVDDPIALREFARNGGPDLRDIRSYSRLEPDKLAQNGNNAVTKSQDEVASISFLELSEDSSTDFADVSLKLIERLIFPHKFRNQMYHRPVISNLKQLEDIMAGADSPDLDIDLSREHQLKFTELSDEARNGKEWMREAFRCIQGTTNMCSASGVLSDNLKPVVEGLTRAKPDYYEGYEPTRLKRHIRQTLSEYIIPSIRINGPMAPNFFVETIGDQGTPVVCKLRACCDGALGARAIHQLRSYGLDPETTYDNNAYTISATYIDGTFSIFAHHPTPSTNFAPIQDPSSPAKKPTAYHMTRLRTYCLIDDNEIFRQGVTAFRNLSIWTSQMRHQFVAQANTVQGPHISIIVPPKTTNVKTAPSIPQDEEHDRSDDEDYEDDEQDGRSTLQEQPTDTSNTDLYDVAKRSFHASKRPRLNIAPPEDRDKLALSSP